MDSILSFISSYINYWPLVCVCALPLAGLNIPVSEDLMIIMSAVIASRDPSLLIPNYLGLYAGITLSDAINYWFGRIVGSGFTKLRLVRKKLTPWRIQKISKQLEEHGFLTFIITRFIPFGVRNALFMTSGMVHFNFLKFLLFNGVAAIISSSTLYWLVYFIGEAAAENFKIVGYVLFGLLIAAAVVLLIRHERKKRSKKMPAEQPASDD